MQVRPAEDDDWGQIWSFLGVVLAAGETYTSPRDITSDQARAEWLAPPPSRTFVAVDGERVVGLAKLRPNLPGAGDHVANAGFVVDPACAGRGVGRRLAEEILARARSMGYAAMQFNAVVETNVHAVALWQALGFRIVGTVPGAFRHPRHGRVGLHVMHREL
ncbi:GNAT family N-acetyltransferase [Actinomycetospora sp. TBRC 11914]|uniref:GNAT family N-acetyltransferase n=1 Tax=Actinomycetospora sp. TBRC 11914 TaxID=2729387 RepID=UPI00145F8FF2|nr:GNAT family N-acetyltransferase [Actinomycetospora sp. TBRC 11914]NMO91386.1 GNAT family N-acetyltransferase [Actinomycetospora sp. TBRC 11914]